MPSPGIGVLALQGDFDAHRRMLAACGFESPLVRLPDQLDGLRGLVIPGGESTTLLRLTAEYGLDEAVLRFASRGGAVFGTCAGAILLARSVTSPIQGSLGLIDVEIERNAWGRQIDSFESTLIEVVPEIQNGASPLPAIFIRAPRIRRVGPAVAVLASYAGEPVLVRQGRVLAATFHPEMTLDRRVHRYFAALAGLQVNERTTDHGSSPVVLRAGR